MAKSTTYHVALAAKSVHDGYVNVESVATDQKSIAAAVSWAQDEVFKKFPPKDGWTSHNFDILELPALTTNLPRVSPVNHHPHV